MHRTCEIVLFLTLLFLFNCGNSNVNNSENTESAYNGFWRNISGKPVLWKIEDTSILSDSEIVIPYKSDTINGMIITIKPPFPYVYRRDTLSFKEFSNGIIVDSVDTFFLLSKLDSLMIMNSSNNCFLKDTAYTHFPIIM